MEISNVLAKLIPIEWIDKIAQARIKQESMGWTVLAGGSSLTSKLGNRNKQLEGYVSHVYKCVNAIKDRMQSIPWRLVYVRGNEEADVDDHPFYDLAMRPNPVWSFQEMLAFAIMHLDLAGRAFWHIERGPDTLPSDIWPLIPSNFNKLIVREGRMEILGYEFFVHDGIKQSVQRKTYPAADIIDYRYPHPLHILDGASPIQQMAYSFDTDMAIRIQQRSFFQNSARPDLVFETDDNPSKESMEQFIMQWNEKHQGSEQRWAPAVLGKGMKAHVLNIPNTDLELMELMKFSKEDILEAYRVPAGKLGTEKNVTKANSYAIDQTFNQECIHPRLILLSEVISQHLLSNYDPNLKIKFDNPVPQDKEFRLEQRRTNLQLGYTAINEERERDGLESVPWGDAPWLSITQMQVGSEPMRPQEEPKAFTVKALKSDQGRARYWQLHNRRMIAYSQPLEKWLQRFFRDLRREVNGNISNQWKRYLFQVEGMSRSKAKLWAKENKEWETLNFDVEEAIRRMKEEGLPFVEQILVLSANDALEFIEELDIAFDLQNPRVLDFMARRENLLVNVVDEVFEDIRKELIEGIEAAESVGQLQQRINENVWQNAEQVRSLRVARTESATATNRGNLEAYRQTGLVERKEWLAAGDARESHLAAHAKYQGDGAIPINADFEVGAGSGPCPGSIGLPEEDINCRCAILPVVGE